LNTYLFTTGEKTRSSQVSTNLCTFIFLKFHHFKEIISKKNSVFSKNNLIHAQLEKVLQYFHGKQDNWKCQKFDRLNVK
jgi:hypothetical protein